MFSGILTKTVESGLIIMYFLLVPMNGQEMVVTQKHGSKKIASLWGGEMNTMVKDGAKILTMFRGNSIKISLIISEMCMSKLSALPKYISLMKATNRLATQKVLKSKLAVIMMLRVIGHLAILLEVQLAWALYQLNHAQKIVQIISISVSKLLEIDAGVTMIGILSPDMERLIVMKLEALIKIIFIRTSDLI